jgi:hypothetical protein
MNPNIEGFTRDDFPSPHLISSFPAALIATYGDNPMQISSLWVRLCPIL